MYYRFLRCTEHSAHTFRRNLGTRSTAFRTKYAHKLKEKADQTGLSVNELLDKANSRAKNNADDELKRLTNNTKQHRSPSSSIGDDIKCSSHTKPLFEKTRKDAPPYKELSTILNLQRLIATPHTAEQISALWTAYHSSRSGGTGRGFLCASVPLPVYEKMMKNGSTYPTFVVSVPHEQQPVQTAQHSESSLDSRETNTAHEFYYLQWDFHPPPPIPSASDDPFPKPAYKNSDGISNPSISTILFTPLQEYKLRQSFATPYLVLTMYTDLALSHGIVLLRGEITPSTSSSQHSLSDRHMLSQGDAHLLTVALQRFYLWSNEVSIGEEEFGKDGKELLIKFHEKPGEFQWQDLLKFSNPSTL